MNFVKLYIGDYQRDTGSLTLAQHGAYMLMIQHYCSTESPLPTGPALHRLLRADNKAERDAIDFVVARFWVPADDMPGGVINRRAAEEIEKSAQSAGSAAARREAERERQQRHRNRRKALFDELRQMGIYPQFDATTDALENALRNAHVTRDRDRDKACDIRRDVTVTATANHSHSQKEREEPRAPDPAGGSPAGEVCKALRASGMAAVNPSHPELLALLASGATVRSFVDTAKELQATKPDKWSFPYLLRTIRGRMEDAKKTVRVLPSMTTEERAAASKIEEIMAAISGRNQGAKVSQLSDGRFKCGPFFYNRDGSEQVPV